MNGIIYIFVFLDRINRIYWIFYSLFPDEDKRIILLNRFILSDLIQTFLDKFQYIVSDSLVGMSGYHLFCNAFGFL
jgi:hypothetical protein